MRKLYTSKTFTNSNSITLVLFAVLLISSVFSSYGQVTVPFTPRTSTSTPSQEIYTVKGDFSMIGNTNLTLASYSDTTNNDNDMIYVDIDGNTNTTFNSSSAELTFSIENGANPVCSKIVYAGLYWSGRAGSDEVFDVTKNGVTKTFNKRKVLINGPNNLEDYVEITANTVTDITEPNKNIYFPSGTEGNMYSAYAEITSYVQQNGLGNYFVADIATLEGDPDFTGYYGGWGMVVVYENSKMNWRDITVFDGHAYVTSGGGEEFIDISGFKAAQNGDVNIKLGVMGGEGDVGVPGDQFAILRQDNGTYEPLSHSGNTTGNFFNSSIVTGGNTRLPNLQNNTGLDIAMFDIDNTGNGIIGNGVPGPSTQSTRFRYNSTQDTYIIFNLTFAVNAYIPELEGVLNITSINGNTPTPPNILEPGQSSDYALQIKNTGTEATNNTIITIPLPDNVNPTNLNIISNTYLPFTTTNTPIYTTGPGFGSNGSIVWELGTLPKPADPDTVLADISFQLTVTTDCTMLSDPSFDPNVSLGGTIEGIGAISNVAFDFPLIQGYQTTGVCTGEPIPTPIMIAIDYIDYINEGPSIVCLAPISQTADTGVDGAIVTYITPVGTDNSTGAVTTQTAGLASGALFPIGTTTNTFLVTDATGNTATCSFTVTVTDDEDPSIVCLTPINQNVDFGICGAIVTYTTPVGTDNSTGAVTTQTAGLASGALFPVGTTTNTFLVTDATGNTATCSFDVTITDDELPVITCPQDISQTADSDQCGAIINIINPTAIDNCSTIFTFTGIRSDNLALSDAYPVGITTITWTATDEASNTSIPCIQTITITDDEAPVFVESLPLNMIVECDQVPIADVLSAIDNCNSINVTFNEEKTDGSCTSNYILERTWIATDNSGNTTTHQQTITVQDTTSPVLSLPANRTAECSADLSTIAFGTATATDNCDANPEVTFNDVKTDGACPGSYTITRTWTATDVCGNTVSANQIISTADTTAPEFVETALPEDITIECDAVPTAETLTATDNCGDATVEVSDVKINGNCSSNYVITRTWTATDACGLTRTHVQTITVQDTTPPVFVESLPENKTVECDTIPDAETLTATDTCSDATVTVNDIKTNGDCPNNYSIARTWTATDACGLTTTHTQVITVQDTTRPEFVETLPVNITVECDDIPTTETLTATDNCGDATVTQSDVRTNDDCPNRYTIARTWIATDACGLTTTHTQTITVQDTKAPEPTTSFEATLSVSCADIPDAPELEFTDNCSTNITIVFDETNSFDENALIDYEIVRTWTVTDECNNEATYTQTLSVTLDEIITEVNADDRCFDDGIVDLNSYLGDINTNGYWELIQGDAAATLTDNIFNPSTLELSEDFLPKDGGIDYRFRYTTTQDGCFNIMEVTMNINADCKVLPCGENDVVISKAITPNGDSYNESFDITGIELCGFTSQVKIFNRWGALVYESNNYQTGENMGAWNGQAHSSSIGSGSKVPNGTYYYIVTLKDSGLKPFTGPVYLGTK